VVVLLVVIFVTANNTSKFIYQLFVTSHSVICLVRITAPTAAVHFQSRNAYRLYLLVTSWSLSI
jgi:hypothetical protein